MARGKLKGKDIVTTPSRRGGRGKGKKNPTRKDSSIGVEQEGSLEVQQSTVRAYSAGHQQWINTQVGRQVVETTVINESHTGNTGRPPDGNIGVHCTPNTT